MELFEMDLGGFAPEAAGYSLVERLDLTGHSSGRVDPHLNTDLVNPDDNVVRGVGRDLTSTQMPGMNGMQY